MKKSKSKEDATQPQIQMHFPFLHLLPPIPIGGLTPEHWMTLSERLHLAVAERSDSPVLNEAESQSYRQNCDVIRKAVIGLHLRNYGLLEVYDAQQWRAEFQSFKDFSKAVADLSKSQVMKCIASARIALLMAEAGLGDVAPRGRQVEELAKVPPDHRLAAWQAVLAAFEKHGNSVSEAKHVLCNYCDDQNIKFGRREPNGSKNICHGSALLPDKGKATVVDPLQQPANKKDWTENLADSEDRALIGILNIDILEKAIMEFDSDSPGIKIGKILQEIGSEHHNDQTSEHMEAALSLVFRKDPVLEEKLRKLALGLLAEAISQKLELQISESQIARAESLEKNYPPINNIMLGRFPQFEPAFDELDPPVGKSQKGVR